MYLLIEMLFFNSKNDLLIIFFCRKCYLLIKILCFNNENCFNKNDIV